MWESNHNKRNISNAAQQFAKMRDQLMMIGERERILEERRADREAYRYLLNAHRLVVSPSFYAREVVNDSPTTAGQGNGLTA